MNRDLTVSIQIEVLPHVRQKFHFLTAHLQMTQAEAIDLVLTEALKKRGLPEPQGPKQSASVAR